MGGLRKVRALSARDWRGTRVFKGFGGRDRCLKTRGRHHRIASKTGFGRRRRAARGRMSIRARPPRRGGGPWARSEEHTSELQSLMRISYAVFCLKKKKQDIKY